MKWKNPIYYRTNIKGGDPRNPLGDRWLGLSVPGTNGYLYGLHGTNDESSIGKYVSAGCIRLYNKDIRWLFDRADKGIPVVVTHSSSSFDSIAKSKGFLSNSKVNKPSSKSDVIPDGSKYVVKKGDTLHAISKKYKMSVSDLKKLNNLKSDIIKIGQSLKVKGAIPSPIVKKPDQNTNTTVTTYKVKPGETLYAISKKYKISVNKLKQLNNLKNNTIRVDQNLKVKATASNSDVKVPVKDTSSNTNTASHKVKAGDTLWRISNTYNISLNKLRSLNNLKGDFIYVGQMLKVK